MNDTLQKRINANRALSLTEISKLAGILGKGCHERTKNALYHALKNVPNIPNYGIYGRVHLSPRVCYCAGQSYPDEIRTVRKCLVG